MKQYLIETFRFNDMANRKMIEKIRQLPDATEPVRFMSHLINSQNKWMERMLQYPQDPDMDWWAPVYTLDELLPQWEESVNRWITFLKQHDETQLFEEAHFVGHDGGHWSAPIKDIALQLNYHSIHHRAQIQMMIRAQGVEPDFIDYIATAYTRHT